MKRVLNLIGRPFRLAWNGIRVAVGVAMLFAAILLIAIGFTSAMFGIGEKHKP